MSFLMTKACAVMVYGEVQPLHKQWHGKGEPRRKSKALSRCARIVNTPRFGIEAISIITDF